MYKWDADTAGAVAQDETVLQRAVSEAARAFGIDERVICHRVCHSLGVHLLARGHGMQTVQELLGRPTFLRR